MSLEEELQALTGKFFSAELETFYTLEVRDTTLVREVLAPDPPGFSCW